MTLDDAITYYGHNKAALARALGITTMALWRWEKKKKIPYEYQCQLQVMTNGTLKAARKHS